MRLLNTAGNMSAAMAHHSSVTSMTICNAKSPGDAREKEEMR
jgi:hypothetical protein